MTTRMTTRTSSGLRRKGGNTARGTATAHMCAPIHLPCTSGPQVAITRNVHKKGRRGPGNVLHRPEVDYHQSRHTTTIHARDMHAGAGRQAGGESKTMCNHQSVCCQALNPSTITRAGMGMRGGGGASTLQHLLARSSCRLQIAGRESTQVESNSPQNSDEVSGGDER